MTSRALVIGGAGFLGRHTIERLAGDGFDTTVLDRPGAPVPPDGAPGRARRYLEGSVSQRDDVERAFDDCEPEVVVHLAAFGAGGRGLVPSAEAHPEEATQTNVLGLVHCLEAVKRRAGVRFVWASSTTVYAPAERYRHTVDEDALVGPRSLYAASKVFGEQLIRTYRDHHGVDAVAVRPTLVWGPGIQYRGVQAALGDLVEAAASGGETVVPGSDEPWDLIYVKDAARALVFAAGVGAPPPVLTATGYVASIDQVRHCVLAAIPDASITVTGDGPRLGFPLVDDSTARSLGFVPEYDLDSSVADYLAAELRSRTTLQWEERT